MNIQSSFPKTALPQIQEKHGFIKFVLGTFLFFAIFINTVHAQALLIPIEDCSALWFPKHHNCKVTLNDGSLVEGEIVSGSGMGSSLESITVQMADGEKVKYQAEDVRALKVTASDLIRFLQVQEGSSSISEMIKSKWSQREQTEFLFFERASQPEGKKQKQRLYLVLNPGFDHKLRVFDDPWGQETGEMDFGAMQVTGGRDKSYLLQQGGDIPFRVKKDDYKKQFVGIFGDCPELIELGGKKPDWDDFPVHTLYYNLECAPVPGP